MAVIARKNVFLSALYEQSPIAVLKAGDFIRFRGQMAGHQEAVGYIGRIKDPALWCGSRSCVCIWPSNLAWSPCSAYRKNSYSWEEQGVLVVALTTLTRSCFICPCDPKTQEALTGTSLCVSVRMSVCCLPVVLSLSVVLFVSLSASLSIAQSVSVSGFVCHAVNENAQDVTWLECRSTNLLSARAT